MIQTTRIRIAAAALSLSLGACQNLVVSNALPTCSETKCEVGTGVVYSLPRAQFLLQASRRPITQADMASAATAVAAANEIIKKDLATLATARAKRADDLSKKASKEIVDADESAIEDTETTLKTDQALEQIASGNLDVLIKANGKGVEAFTLTQQPAAPDPGARYRLDPQHSVLRDDTLKFDFSSGMLTSASTTSIDQSLNSFVKLAEAGITLAAFSESGIPLVPTGPVAAAAPQAFPVECTYELAELFDPLNKDEVERVKNALVAVNASIQLDVDSPLSVSEKIIHVPTDVKDVATTTYGLAYRTPTSVIVSVKAVVNAEMWKHGGPKAGGTDCPLQSKPGAASMLALVPDSRSHYVLDTHAGAFTTTALSYTFTNGMLTESSTSKPSEVVAPFAALGQLAQDVVAIPGSIVKLRLDYANNTADLVKAQTALVNDQSERAVAAYSTQTALANARAALIKAEFGDRQAFVDAESSLLNAQQALEKLQSGNKTAPSAATPAGSPTNP